MKDRYTIQDLADGNVYVRNDGTLEQLKKVLKEAFPEDKAEVFGNSKFYKMYLFLGVVCWTGVEAPSLSGLAYSRPVQSVGDFILKGWIPKEGELVSAWDDDGLYGKIEAVFIYKMENQKYPYIVLPNEEAYKAREEEFNFDSYQNIGQINKKVEVTFQEVADKFECDVEDLIIKSNNGN